MKTITTAFTRAATGNTVKTSAGITVFWLMIIALAILDDSERREQERRRKADTPKHEPRPAAGPGPF